MKTHTPLQETVLSELAWDPMIDASRIGVAAEEGVVTLTGTVTSYAQKMATEDVVKRIAGVRAVANELEVAVPGFGRKSDSDLAQTCLQALAWDVDVPHDGITVKVEDGRVTLEGTVQWHYQRAAAARAIRGLMGVTDVFNQIAIRPGVLPSEVTTRIEAALHRQAEIEARNVKVETRDRKVILRGDVHTWRERQQVENAAWSAPGVQDVENDLIVKI